MLSWGELGNYINAIDRSSVNWEAIELLRSSAQWRTPDLGKEAFEFDLDLLSVEGRSGFSTILSQHRQRTGAELRVIVTQATSANSSSSSYSGELKDQHSLFSDCRSSKGVSTR
jgi:hypothetical protein